MTPASTEKVDFSKKGKEKTKTEPKKTTQQERITRKKKTWSFSVFVILFYLCCCSDFVVFLDFGFLFSVCSDFVFWFYIVFSVEPYIICALGLINPTIIIYWYLLKLRLERLFLTVTAGKPRPSLQALRLATFALAVPRLMRHMRSQEPRGMARTGQNTIHSLVYPRISQASQV